MAATTELDAIKLAPSHRRLLTETLDITTLLDLVLTERQRIIDAAADAKVRRPTPEQVAAWQDEARRRLSAGAGTTADATWDEPPYASFVVCFRERRRPDHRRERRIEVAQTEVEPPPPPTTKPGWDCGWLCEWMTGVLGLADGEPTPRSDERPLEAHRPAQPAVVPSPDRDAEPRQAVTRPASPQPSSAIACTLDDGGRRVDLLAEPDGAVVTCDRSGTIQLALATVSAERASGDAIADPSANRRRVVVRARGEGRSPVTIADEIVELGDVVTIALAGLAVGAQHLVAVVSDPAGRHDPQIARLRTLDVQASRY